MGLALPRQHHVRVLWLNAPQERQVEAVIAVGPAIRPCDSPDFLDGLAVYAPGAPRLLWLARQLVTSECDAVWLTLFAAGGSGGVGSFSPSGQN